ncbi:MAG: hypothetical protein ABH870_04895 [bacterium]
MFTGKGIANIEYWTTSCPSYQKKGMNMKRLLLSLIILLTGMSSICWGNGACTTAMPFLSMGMGVRASAMAKAFCAVADDNSAMYWNPAGLGQIKRRQMNLEYARWFEDVAYTSVSGVYPLKKTAIGVFTNIRTYAKQKNS